METGGVVLDVTALEGLIPTENSDDNPGSQINPTKSDDVFSQITPTKSDNVFSQINPAMVPTVAATTIVRDVLSEGNYANWSACVQQYLVGHGLWEVCDMRCEVPDKTKDPVAYSQWERKNAMALHAIQISCSQMMLSQIRNLKLANLAWGFLERNAKPTRYFDQEPSGDEQLPPADEFSTENPDFSQYERLLQALQNGSWNDIEDFLNTNPDAVRAKLEGTGLTPLHVAAANGHVKVVDKLVDILKEEDLELKEDLFGLTPLAFTALEGDRNVTRIARAMIRKNRRLPNIPSSENTLPVEIACNQNRGEMTRFLYIHTDPAELDPQKAPNGAKLLLACISAELLDIALDMTKKHPRLGFTFDMKGNLPLHLLGQRPNLFKCGSQLWFWQRWIYECINANLDPTLDGVQLNVPDDNSLWQDKTSNTKKVLQFLHGLISYPLELLGINNIYAQKLIHTQTTMLLHVSLTELNSLNIGGKLAFRIQQAVIQAVRKGNVDFVVAMVKNNPDIIWDRDINGRNILTLAIMNRHERIFDLFHGLSNAEKMNVAFLGDRFHNTMLHLAAMLPPLNKLDNISGPALKMQRELQWYKEVESVMPSTAKDIWNSDGKKPAAVFSEQHAGLVKEGEKWMKEIATSSSFLAALIVTITFAAAFTIPGGNNDEGAPIFLDNKLFMAFIVSDSISLFSATTSVLMFSVILTSEYSEEKFLWELPTKLIIGLSSLFVSIAAMMIAFCAALAILLEKSSTNVIIPIVLLASLPVTLFALMQFPLLVKIFISTYGPSIFNRKKPRWSSICSD